MSGYGQAVWLFNYDSSLATANNTKFTISVSSTLKVTT